MIAIEPTRTALLLMDFQADIVGRFGQAAAAVERAAELLAAARAAKVPVVYVVVGFRPGYPEVSPKNAMFSMLTQRGGFLLTTPGADIVPALRPEPSDVVVVKHRVGAFSGTDLEMVLRAKDVDTLVVAGIATSGVVLSTVRHAADADYRLFVATDACADGDDEVHRVLTQKVLPRQATVTTTSELAAALSGARRA